MTPAKPNNNLPDELKCIEEARQHTLEWAKASGITLVDLEPAIPAAILTQKRFWVWLFYYTDNELNQYESNGTTQKIKDEYLSQLKKLNCPEEYLEGIIFFTDTEENAIRFANLKPVDY